METGKMKLALSAGAIALSMALVGCGGGSSPSTPQSGGGLNCTGDEVANAANDACIPRLTNADCSNGQVVNSAGNQCVDPPQQAKMGADAAKALKAAINLSTPDSFRWTSAATPGAINDIRQKPAHLGPTDARIGLLKDEVTVPDLGSWKGNDHSGKDSSGTSAMMRVYSNKAAVRKASSFSVAGDIGSSGLFSGVGGGDTDAIISDTGAYSIRNGGASGKVEADAFPAVGAASNLKTYVGAAQRTIEGKYDGAEGTFKCTGTTACTATRGTGGITFAGTWTFTPGAGQTNDVKDTKYLEFGWWVHKDKSKMPTHADVFYDSSTASAPLETASIQALDGKTATYEGAAAGKFAIHDPVDSRNNESGHFTADAMLKATFDEGDTASSMTGTIDNFRLNDGTANPGWSVNLEKANWVAEGRFEETSNGTLWSIGENNKNGTPNGNWEAQLFRTGTATTGIPDTVGGAFHSTIGSTHEMRGAFGATHQPSE